MGAVAGDPGWGEIPMTAFNRGSGGNEGVRITVVRASDHSIVTTPFDLTNKTASAGMYHFGKVVPCILHDCICRSFGRRGRGH